MINKYAREPRLLVQCHNGVDYRRKGDKKDKLWQFQEVYGKTIRAGGGIMTLDEPRQGYFLGKLRKS